jgi:nicotinate-nucleotide adenylyltransferase
MKLIYGGTFNPITNGHLEAALSISKIFDNHVSITPCYKHLFKNDILRYYHRINMCKVICNKYPDNLLLNTIEIQYKLGGSTLDLIEFLNFLYVGEDIYLIIGMDQANVIHTWKNYKKLLEIGKFIVLPRKGVKFKEDLSVNWYKKDPHIYLPECNIIECESKNIRQFFKDQNLEKAKQFIDEDIFNYIVDYKLYN